ncbi:MAG: D-Ala-D-Ala carboxypeptidase family metallohydrolase [Pseudomonadota bacterium]|nr:D-Ala-D-Ala carboxypeptidase family metallohydrolase [Pseudomonadota bacterium]
MIALHDYYQGRDSKFRGELTLEIQRNAAETVRRVNSLLAAMADDGVVPEVDAAGSLVSSGWRPSTVNARVPGAAVRSKHLTAQACDLFDPEGELDAWCMQNQQRLAFIGLWLEHASATKGWCHIQTVPPRSGTRIFYP